MMVEGPTVSRAGFCIFAQFSFLFCGHQRPAHDGAAKGRHSSRPRSLLDEFALSDAHPQGKETSLRASNATKNRWVNALNLFGTTLGWLGR